MGSNDNKSEALKSAAAFRTLIHQILTLANQITPRFEFLQQMLSRLLEFTGCEAVELWLREDQKCLRCHVTSTNRTQPDFKFIPCPYQKRNQAAFQSARRSAVTALCCQKRPGPAATASAYRVGQSLLFENLAAPALVADWSQIFRKNFVIEKQYQSYALIPLFIGEERIGLLHLKSERPHFITRQMLAGFENSIEILSSALLSQRTQAALNERVKELTCLFGILKVVEQPDLSIPKILQAIVELLPPAWQYPEIAVSRIVFDGEVFTSSGYKNHLKTQSAVITINGKPRGRVEVGYLIAGPELDEGPFLQEERNLIETIARQISLVLERKQAEEEGHVLEEQLRHADRLATIGQLAAGLAHELNEPLSNILGFAQLIEKDTQEIPEQTRRDVWKISAAALHAREVIKKLMLFARQMPPRKTRVNLNHLVIDGLFFLEARCAKEGIEVVRSLAMNLPEIVADQAQLQQVLVNLVVNAIQSMPEGGRLDMKTFAEKDTVSLVVQDTGCGMSEEVKKQMFLPFFSTKKVGHGTGIGLSVVHGIVTAHGGTIEVQTEVGKGTRFQIRLPINNAN